MQPDKTTVLIVDDESNSRETLMHHLKTIPEIKIIGSVSGVDEAYQFLLEHVPDILFLDVEMPGKSGFVLLDEIRKLEICPCIIFQTAFEKYAIEAIKHAAFDYLLKPIDKEELLVAIARFRNEHKKQELSRRIEDLLLHLNLHRKMRFNTRSGFIMVDESEIIYCQADWSYTELFLLAGKKIVVSMNIGKVEEMLNPEVFFRLNRSVIIRHDAVESADRKKKQCIIAYNGERIQFRIPMGQIRKLDNWLRK